MKTGRNGVLRRAPVGEKGERHERLVYLTIRQKSIRNFTKEYPLRKEYTRKKQAGNALCHIHQGCPKHAPACFTVAAFMAQRSENNSCGLPCHICATPNRNSKFRKGYWAFPFHAVSHVLNSAISACWVLMMASAKARNSGRSVRSGTNCAIAIALSW